MNKEAIARGQRVKLLRQSLNLSRQAFTKLGISLGTLQNIEDARYEKTDITTIEKLVNIFTKQGIPCERRWLQDGTGTPPRLLDNQIMLPTKEAVVLDTLIEKELAFFRETHGNVLDTIVNDNTMQPFAFKGDVVAGMRYFAKDIQKLVKHYCIIQTKEGDTLVRYITAVDKKGLYTLSCLNPTNDSPKNLKNCAIFSAAAIIWLRRESAC